MTFFPVRLNLSGKLNMYGGAALEFKIFSNAPLRVNIIAPPPAQDNHFFLKLERTE